MPRRTVPRRSLLVAASAGALVSGCSEPTPTPSEGVRRDAGVLTTTHWPGHEPRWMLAAPSARVPRGLLVCLHGYGGDARASFEDGLGLQRQVASTGLAVVSVDGGNGYWHRRKDGSDTGAMVLQDLIPLALRRAGLPTGAPIALLGWSMGGFGALWLASTLPRNRVAAVVAESSALWLDPGLTPQGAFEDREDFERHTPFNHLDALAALPIRLDCGRSDPFVAANRALAARLPAARTTVDAGGHVMPYWRDHAAAQLRWVSGRF